jgi:excisionase family DNA binding protein
MEQKSAMELLEDGAMTVNDAVEWSGIRRTRLYQAMADGRLPSVKEGRRRLIPRVALRRLLAENLVE